VRLPAFYLNFVLMVKFLILRQRGKLRERVDLADLRRRLRLRQRDALLQDRLLLKRQKYHRPQGLSVLT